MSKSIQVLFFLFITFSHPIFSTLHVFGDSHSRMFKEYPDTKIHYRGPITMHRIGRDNKEFIRLKKHKIKPNDLLIMVFGEIDIRCHIKKITEKIESTPEDVLADLAHRYCQGIAKITEQLNPLQVIICEVIPPVNITDPVMEACFKKCRFPIIGTYLERVHYHTLLNQLLKAECEAFGYRFFQYSHLCKDEKGCLNPALADSTVHIHPDHTHIIQNALSAFLNPHFSS